jgi:hypothetical protein
MRGGDEHFAIGHDRLSELDAEAGRVCAILRAGIKEVRDIGSVVSAQNGGRGRGHRVLNGVARQLGFQKTSTIQSRGNKFPISDQCHPCLSVVRLLGFCLGAFRAPPHPDHPFTQFF